jgi:hypothetical protein
MKTSILGFLGALAFTIAGATASQAQQPKRGGTLQFAISAETPNYDCHGSDTYATLHFSAPFYNTLLRFNLAKFPEIEGDLADSWTIAPDLMSYTFKLHPGVKFHDGTPLTSADVKATYDRMRNPPAGVVSTRQATFADVGTIETPDANTVIFKMKAVNASMLDHFASPWNCIYSAKDLAADANAPKTKINGTGPFVFWSMSKAAMSPASATTTTSSRACPISTASGACSPCRRPRCSTLFRADSCSPSTAASRQRSATAWSRRWATRSASRNRAGRSTSSSSSTPSGSHLTTCACARRC